MIQDLIDPRNRVVRATRTREVQTAIDALISLLARDPWMRQRYGVDGERCPIVALRDDTYRCLLHDVAVNDHTASSCSARAPRQPDPRDEPPCEPCGYAGCDCPRCPACIRAATIR